MTALGLLVRAGFRRRWRSWLALVVLLGLGAGAGLALVASARRTASAYPRFLEAAGAPDIVIDYSPDSPAVSDRLAEAIAAVPGVDGVHDVVALNVLDVDEDGQPDLTFPSQFLAPADDRPAAPDVPAVVEGRLPDPGAPGEVLVNEELAEARDLVVGDRVDLDFVGADQVAAFQDGAPLDPEPVSFEVVGIGIRTNEVIVDDIAGETTMVGTLPFALDHLDGTTFHLLHVDLAPGLVPSDLIPQLEDVAAAIAGQGEFSEVQVQDRTVTLDRAQRALRPVTITLGLLGGALLLAVAVLVGQGLVRLMMLDEEDVLAVRSLGVSRTGLGVWSVVTPVLTITAGAGLAALVALGLSPLGPAGSVRPVEPDPGLTADLVVLGAGPLLLVVLLSIRVALAAIGRLRRREALGAHRPSRWGRAASALPLSWGLGVRSAVEVGGGRARLATRATLLGASGAVLALAGLATFDAGRRQLAEDSSLYGWNWDAAVQWQGGYGVAEVGELRDDARIGDLAIAQFLSVPVEGRLVPAMVVHPASGALTPTIIEGRPPRGDEEVALGADTLAATGKEVGDRVRIEAEVGEVDVLVSGIAVFPALGLSDSERPNLGTGLLAERPLDATPDAESGLSTALIRFVPGVDPQDGLRHLETTYASATEDAQLFDAARPADLASFQRLGSGPMLAVGLFGVATLATLAHGLLVGARRRRPEHGLLRALGLDRRQLRSLLVSQATTTMGIALVIGVPLGVAVGRTAWQQTAEAVGTAVQPVVPLALLAAIAMALLAGAGLVALWPARQASRLRPADALTDR